jgi:DNA invertase Pin-like site-specific DNA recombinase
MIIACLFRAIARFRFVLLRKSKAANFFYDFMYYAIAENEKQKTNILAFAHEKQLVIKKFISLEELHSASANDVIIADDMTIFGGTFVKSLSVCVSLAEMGVQLLFVQNRNLSVSDKSMFEIFRSILEVEKQFISIRTKAGQKAAREQGVSLGRPKGSANKKRILDNYKEEIQKYLQKDVALTSVMKIINASLEKPLSYFTYRRYIEEQGLCK